MATKFECPHCGQRVEGEDDWSGMKLECPACSGGITIPQSKETDSAASPVVVKDQLVTVESDESNEQEATAQNMPIETPEATQTKPQKKGLAMASLVCGIIGGWFSTLSIPAVICGHMALSKIKKEPNTYGGKGLAIAGLILGYLGLVLAFIGVMLRLETEKVIQQLQQQGKLNEQRPLPLPRDWQRAVIPNVGTIDIPPTMEVAKGTYVKVKTIISQQLKIPIAKFVIQQKGLNDLNPEAFNLYVRVLVDTDLLEKAGCTLHQTWTEKQQLKKECQQLKKEYQQVKILIEATARKYEGRIIKWDPITVQTISGMTAIRIGYKRQLNTNPPVVVEMYSFPNYDRIHLLTLSYRETEKAEWAKELSSVLSRFRITNVRTKFSDRKAQ